MSEVKRYMMVSHSDRSGGAMIVRPNGTWVRYSDYKELEMHLLMASDIKAEIANQDKLRAENKRLHNALAVLASQDWRGNKPWWITFAEKTLEASDG